MALHPDQTILGAVQEGRCSCLSETNPYGPKNKKRYLGWEQGHKDVVEEHRQQLQYDNSPLLRRFLCKIGMHKYNLTRVPGRPHIDCNTGNIDRRDPIVKKYTCICCDDVYFMGLNGR